MATYTIFEGSDQWSAAYKDGRLLYGGDHHNVHEHLFADLGIEVIQSDAFNPHGRVILDTEAEVRAEIAAEEAAANLAAQMRAEAARLLEEAAALDGRTG